MRRFVIFVCAGDENVLSSVMILPLDIVSGAVLHIGLGVFLVVAFDIKVPLLLALARGLFSGFKGGESAVFVPRVVTILALRGVDFEARRLNSRGIYISRCEVHFRSGRWARGAKVKNSYRGCFPCYQRSGEFALESRTKSLLRQRENLVLPLSIFISFVG